jgi:hypothetical protein
MKKITYPYWPYRSRLVVAAVVSEKMDATKTK